MLETSFTIQPIGIIPIGIIHSELKSRAEAPRQGYLDAPDAWLEVYPAFAEGVVGIAEGDEIILLTWLHLSDRNLITVHPHHDPSRPLTGVFATRSPDRPNPVGLHRVTVLEILENRIKVQPLEAIDGTPLVDIKPVLQRSASN